MLPFILARSTNLISKHFFSVYGWMGVRMCLLSEAKAERVLEQEKYKNNF